MKNVISDWEKHNIKLDTLSSEVDDFIQEEYFRKFTVWPFHCNTYVMHNEITALLSMVYSWDDNILEVGGGIGNFCRCLHDRIQIKSYTILDTSSMLRFSKSLLARYTVPCNFVEAENYKSLFGKKFDLFISNICISELPLEYSNDLLDNILPNCDVAFIIDSEKKKFSDWMEGKINSIFTNTRFFSVPDSFSTQKKHKIYLGVKNQDERNEKCPTSL